MSPSCYRGAPEPPYYGVIFSSERTPGDRGYAAVADRMLELAPQQTGFLGVESARSGDGFGITVSYWRTADDIAAWKKHSEHRGAQDTGSRQWYSEYQVRIARVERAYSKSVSELRHVRSDASCPA